MIYDEYIGCFCCTDKAISIRQGHVEGEDQIILPDLLLYEVSNALRYHPDFSPAELKQAVNTLFDMEFEIITPTLTLLNKTIDIAREQDITCYDATYLALADELEDILITADQKFLNKLSDHYKSICRLLNSSEETDEKT